jgi:orotate phosphoribosyltransferase
MMTSDEVYRLLEGHNAIIRNTHVVYTSGKHGDAYVNKDALYPDTAAVSSLCASFAAHFQDRGVEVVAAPAVGGVALSQWTAHHLSRHDVTVLAVYAEKQADSSFVFRRGYDSLVRDHKVLVVEDVLTTGASVKAVVEAVRLTGGDVLGVAAICNRGDVQPQYLGTSELFALTHLVLQAWEEPTCPLCASGVPINTTVGKGREYLLAKGRRL